MRLGCLSDEHLALIEFENKCNYGNYLEDGDPFICQGAGQYCKGSPFNALLNARAIVKKPISTDTWSTKYQWTLSADGLDYLNMRRKGGYFNVASDDLRRAMWSLVGGIQEGASDFERNVLVEYGALKEDKGRYQLTKKGEKVSYKYLPDFLRYFCSGHAWTLEIGPNISLYNSKSGTAQPTFGSWRRALRADYQLLNAVKGIGVPLMDQLSSKHKQYAAMLIKASSYEEVVDQIVEAQLKDPDKFVFCTTTHDDIVNYLMRKANIHVEGTSESNNTLSMSNA